MEERAVILYDSWTGEYDRIPMSEWKKMKPELSAMRVDTASGTEE